MILKDLCRLGDTLTFEQFNAVYEKSKSTLTLAKLAKQMGLHELIKYQNEADVKTNRIASTKQSRRERETFRDEVLASKMKSVYAAIYFDSMCSLSSLSRCTLTVQNENQEPIKQVSG